MHTSPTILGPNQTSGRQGEHYLVIGRGGGLATKPTPTSAMASWRGQASEGTLVPRDRARKPDFEWRRAHLQGISRVLWSLLLVSLALQTFSRWFPEVSSTLTLRWTGVGRLLTTASRGGCVCWVYDLNPSLFT